MGSDEKVRLDLALPGGGWLEGALQVGTANYPLLASHIEDTPGQLLDATRAACLGSNGDVVWLQEPGAELWRLQANADALHLTVDAAATWPKAGWSPGPKAVTHAVTRVGWLRAVVRALSVLGGDEKRYQDEWRRGFPAPSLQAVRDLLAEERTRG